MFAYLYLALLATLAYHLRTRVALLASFSGLQRYLCSCALTLFLATWVNLLLFAVCGAGVLYLRVAWAVPLVILLYCARFPQPIWSRAAARRFISAVRQLLTWRSWDPWAVLLAAFVLARFYAGLDLDDQGNFFSVFSFVDTAFHLSVVNAFLAAPGFPPMDLDMAPFPLKYHFLADFNVSHLVRLGLTPLTAIWLMNMVSSAIMVGVLWATFQQWLKLSSRWVLLAALVFLFLNTSLLNLVHYILLRPPYLDPGNFFYGLLRFPYFNFESMQPNLLEPQRALLFSLPILLLILHAAFGGGEAAPDDTVDRHRTLQAFGLVCLLPFSHIVGFAVMAPCLLPKLARHFRWFLRRWPIWLPLFALGVLQLLYLRWYGPPANPHFSSWSGSAPLPLRDFAAFPPYARRFAFWFFVNGDFLFWGGLFALLAFACRRRDPATHSSARLWLFLRQWRWYFAVCLGFFFFINVARYSFDWGDSNKFVFFLNLGLALVIALGAARRDRAVAGALWLFFFVLCTGPFTYGFIDNVLNPEERPGAVLLFEKNGRATAAWAKAKLKPTDLILTSANNTFHFITALAGRPTLAGIYGDSNPYRQDERTEEIRRVYEQADLATLRRLATPYLCISRAERGRYTMSPRWKEWMRAGTAIAFSSGEGPQDFHSVYIFDTRRLLQQASPAKP